MSAHNLLVLSDVHLGSDLVHHVRPEAPRSTATTERRDRDLAALFDWYRDHPQGGRPWRLVIAGDFVDFAGMSVMAETPETAPTAEERMHGLGSAEDHTLAKLRLVMAHDIVVMRSLARFVAAGNSLVIVRGNHDVEWHWAAVQTEFRRGLGKHAPFDPTQIEFAPWFYYEEGVAFVEHGHQYDAYCSYDHLLHPVSPADPRRTMRSLSEVLVRYVVRPTHGMSEGGHDVASALDYVRFALRLGVGGMLALVGRFVRATRALLDLWREHVSDTARRVRREHERRMRQLGRLHRIQLAKLRSLARLHRPPVTRTLFGILTSVMLDRVMFGFFGAVALATCLLWIRPWTLGLVCAAAATLALFGLGALVRRLRHAIETSAELRERSALVAKLFPAAFVVMGHTHLPESHATTEQTTYVNLGAWAEEEPQDGAPALPATRTHLVFASIDDRPVAELLVWGPDGPLPFRGDADSSRILKLFRVG